jgi:hypothetical protein
LKQTNAAPTGKNIVAITSSKADEETPGMTGLESFYNVFNSGLGSVRIVDGLNGIQQKNLGATPMVFASDPALYAQTLGAFLGI